MNGLLKTEDALSDLSPGTIWFSLVAFIALSVLLMAVNTWILARSARQGPEAPATGTAPAEPLPVLAF